MQNRGVVVVRTRRSESYACAKQGCCGSQDEEKRAIRLCKTGGLWWEDEEKVGGWVGGRSEEKVGGWVGGWEV